MKKPNPVWQADVYSMFTPVLEAGQVVRPPFGLVLDPNVPFIAAARIFPDGRGRGECLEALIAEAC